MTITIAARHALGKNSRRGANATMTTARNIEETAPINCVLPPLSSSTDERLSEPELG